jgi:hypothetical protein
MLLRRKTMSITIHPMNLPMKLITDGNADYTHHGCSTTVYTSVNRTIPVRYGDGDGWLDFLNNTDLNKHKL